MYRRVVAGLTLFPLLLLLCSSFACVSGGTESDTTLIERTHAAGEAYLDAARRFRDGGRNLPAGQFQAHLQAFEKNRREIEQEWQKILTDIPADTTDTAAKIMRCRLLIQLNRTAEARQAVNKLLRDPQVPANVAALENVKLLLLENQVEQAAAALRAIGAEPAADAHLYNAWLLLALRSRVPETIQEFAGRFLQVTEPPPDLEPYQARVALRLAALAWLQQKPERARELVAQARKTALFPTDTAVIQAMEQQLSVPRQPLPPLSAETWFGQRPTTPGVTVVAFWAPWVPQAGEFLNALSEFQRRRAATGITVVTVTKLYGDDRQAKPTPLDQATETERVRAFLAGHSITLPSAVSTTGRDFANLHIIVLPSIVVLDRMGQPVAWLNGADAVSLLPALASPLLEE